jgi:hypothetical protein
MNQVSDYNARYDGSEDGGGGGWRWGGRGGWRGGGAGNFEGTKREKGNVEDTLV